MNQKAERLKELHARKVRTYLIAYEVHAEAARREIVTDSRMRRAAAAMERSGRELDRLEKAVL